MKYEWVALLVVITLVGFFSMTRRWFRWPFSLRTLCWCGGFSYLVLLGLPRIYIWLAVDTVVQVMFWLLITILFVWILSYHNSK